ncbi:hypothetical protein SAMN05444695_102161 [Rhodococcus triatomae]|uniref:Low molecular weight antigen MTB12-like C-terminal domain-containing protein n=1 Tax=Rhodococcus triatomae TaxID=300028 RepID=A0A1G8D081_9NOCA|nr:hypothetical protein SAMN05444695_102161 [Rhodococcus triatomae]
MTVAGVAIVAALTMSACGSDDSDNGADATTTTTAAADTTTAASDGDIEVPTAAEFNELLVIGLDPATPIEEKITMVEGSEEDPELINQVAESARLNNAEVTVLDPVIYQGDGLASAQLQLSINGEPVEGGFPVSFVNEDDTWKLSKDSACQIVGLAQLTSPACPAP